MKRHTLTRAGFGLLTASVALPVALFAATPASAGLRTPSPAVPGPLVRVAADCGADETPEDCAARLSREQAPAQEAPPEEASPPPEEPPPAAEPPAEAASEPQPEPEPPQAEEPPPPPAAEQPPAEEEPPPPPAEEPAPPAQEPASPVEEPPPPAAEQPAQPEPQPEPAPQEEPAAPQAEQPPETLPEAVEPPPVEEPQPTPEVAPPPEPAPVPEDVPTPEVAPQPDPAPAMPSEGAAPADAGQPAGRSSEIPAHEPTPAGQPADQGAAQPQGQAPVLDSQKPATDAAGKPVTGEPGAAVPPATEAATPPVDPGPPPDSDAAAQREAQPADIQPVTAEEGRRIERKPEDRPQRERPEGLDVLREIGDRIIIQFNNQTIVESNERPRMSRGARDVYYEELPRGRVRETIVRRDGTQVVTVRNAYGDVVRRSRITPDGREYVLVYVDDEDYDRVRDWRDPGEDLPPLRLTIPVEDYVLESERARDAEAYYDFLEQPPVERVERLYSVDEVKRSARIRDKTRRVDLDTVTFEFGSASIVESEIPRLENVASAMERMLERNPAETFLIEGHTDAVGSDVANLALSDRRAEAVADALTNVFGIPPENLATQGYGERYLKVRTQEPERENRRVAIRRITPLVAPVASNQ